MIRSSKHTLKFANKGKLFQLSKFVDEYKCALEFYISYLWNARIGDGDYVLDVAQGLYICPKFIESKIKPNETKLSKCKDGSKGMAKASNHRKNHVNWLVKQLNLLEVKELKLENVENIKYGAHVSRKLKHWSNPLIRDSLIKLCEEQGVLVSLVDNEYNSQRCNQCGWTQKANRKGKLFKCLHCHHENDADVNAALNILNRFLLIELPFGFRKLKKNLEGFFWNPNSLISKFGEDLTVPQTTIN